jgi:hypothetical protein
MLTLATQPLPLEPPFCSLKFSNLTPNPRAFAQAALSIWNTFSPHFPSPPSLQFLLNVTLLERLPGGQNSVF